MNRLTTMNDDDYESRLLLVYLSFLLQRIIAASSIISTTRRSFFFFLAGTVRKTHICTLSHALNTPLTTHQKAFRVFFFIIVCFVCVLAYYTTITITTTTRQCRSLCLFCFNFGLSCCLLFYYFLWPSSDTRELKIQDLPNKDPLSQKAFHCMEYKNKKQRSIPYPHAPHRARLCTSYNHNQQSNPVSVIPCLRPASGNVWQPSSADLNTKRGKPALAMHLTLHRVADRALLVGKPNFFKDTYQLKKYSVKGPRCRSSGVGQG